LATKVTLAANALTTMDGARTYLGLRDDDKDQLVATIVNKVSAAIEVFTDRKLLSQDLSLVLDGNGSQELRLPQWPCTAAASLRRRDDLGTQQALITTGMTLDDDGIIRLPFDIFTRGRRNILADVTCGYKAGIHDSQLLLLRHACERWAIVVYQDQEEKTGRAATLSAGGVSIEVEPSAIPADVAKMLLAFQRLSLGL
jgi:uncharacterized phiE125 gp8 family phage protein